MTLFRASITTTRFTFAVWLWIVSLSCSAADHAITVAVAANFKPTLEKIATRYQSDHDISVKVVSGSTGALFAQLMHQAPFDIFLAADAARPQALEQAGKSRSRSTYAYGRLVLFTPSQTEPDEHLLKTVNRVALANPRHAPYGIAANEILKRFNSQNIKKVYGSNVAQAFAFVKTGNVAAGFVAYSQVLQDKQDSAHYWLIPADHYQPIEQQFVVMKNAPAAADAFANYLLVTARPVIKSSGYSLPGVTD